MTPPIIIQKIALAVLKDGKILMVRTSKNKDVFYTLGGKVEEGESDRECLVREVKEEAGSEIIADTIKFLKEFEAPAYGRENTLVNVRLCQGKLASDPVPSSEVVEIKYFDSSIDKKHLTPLTELIFAWLESQGLIR